MAKKVKKSLTASQKQRRYRVIEKTTFYSEFVSIATPYGIMCAVNFDDWFQRTESWKIGLGGSLAIALMCIAILSITHDDGKKKSRKTSYIKLLLGWIASACIFFLLADIMNQIGEIMLMGAIGIAFALGLDITSGKYKTLADLYKGAREKVRQENIEDEVRQEVNQKQEESDEENERRAFE